MSGAGRTSGTKKPAAAKKSASSVKQPVAAKKPASRAKQPIAPKPAAAAKQPVATKPSASRASKPATKPPAATKPAAPSRTYRATLRAEGALCAVPVPFDPREVFGQARPPVVVTLPGHRYRSTISSMGGSYWVPLRRSNREAAGLRGDETLTVTLALDDAPRTVEAPADLRDALTAAALWPRWQAMSYSHQREHVDAIDQAKQPATRARRIAACVAMVASKAR